MASIAGVVSSMAVLLLTIHWKQLKRPHMALIKLIFLAMCIFGIGTLPWQQHIVGLMGGIVCGTVLTITMVPFLSITKYGRKSKVLGYMELAQPAKLNEQTLLLSDKSSLVMHCIASGHLCKHVHSILSISNGIIDNWLVGHGFNEHK